MASDHESTSETSNLEDAIIITQDDISNYNPSQVLPLPSSKTTEIRKWLRPTDYDIPGGEYRKHLSSHMPGTGNWLLSSDTFLQWLNSKEKGLLWIKGIPGSGKSVMAAHVINELVNKTDPKYIVLFFFFRQIIDANHNPRSLIRDWMDQVLEYSPPLQQQLYTYVGARRAVDSITSEDMWKHLRMAFANIPSNLFCVADALDEMDKGNDAFLEALGEMGQWRPEKVKVLVTSRPVPMGSLQKVPCLHIRLSEKLVDGDISVYVKSRMAHSNISRVHQEAITNAVPGRANGLFLYCRLAMDAFLEQGAVIDEVMSQLPADLNVLYSDLLKVHAHRSGVNDSLQRLLLQAVTHARRPLRLLELAEMIRFNNLTGFQDIKANKKLIKDACGPLLEILADETVSVIHHSFTEYLKCTTRHQSNFGYQILEFGPTHAQLALVCLQYLQGGSLDSLPASCFEHDAKDMPYHGSYDLPVPQLLTEEIRLRMEYPFFDYAASNWSHHANEFESSGCDNPEVTAEVQKFLGNDHMLKGWVHCKWPTSKEGKKLVTPAHVTARLGLVACTKELLKTTKPDVLDGCGRTPLWWAAFEGKAAIVRELAGAGANINHGVSDGYGFKALHVAARGNHHEAVDALLKAGVNPLTDLMHSRYDRSYDGNKSKTALMYACEMGHLETVDVFLAVIDDIDVLQEGLTWAAQSGRHRVVARLLEQPLIDVDYKINGLSALFLACSSLNVSTVDVLLKAGADPSIYYYQSGLNRNNNGNGGLTCLQRACGIGYIDDDPDRMASLGAIVELLIQAGADVNQRLLGGGTTLHGASRSPFLTRLLLEAGADPHARNDNGQTPLHLSISEDVVSLLIEHGQADIESKDLCGRTPFLIMMGNDVPAARKLMEYGPNRNAVDNQGNGALHLLRWNHHRDDKTDMLEALLNSGADPNMRNNKGLTPIHSLPICNRKVAKLLLDAGADFDARDKNGKTVLFQTISQIVLSNLSTQAAIDDVEHLVRSGVSLSARDNKGRTLFHEAVKLHIYFDVLSEMGFDIRAVDYAGNGLLHELALSELDNLNGRTTIPIWEELVGFGLDVSQKNHRGRTPLHILCTSSHVTPQRNEERRPIEFLLSRMAAVNVADVDGNTPLHMAATTGEFYTKKLLDAGADPTVCNHEGLTPLHIASRCRESNVVGVLLDALRKRQCEPVVAERELETEPKSDENHRGLPLLGVNARAFKNDDTLCKPSDITPLLYACRSGRPETVALLLESGADLNMGNLFNACVGFEEEDRLWQSVGEIERDNSAGDVAGLRLHDNSRPRKPLPRREGGNRFDPNLSPRLGDILELLMEYGIDMSKLVRQGSNPGPIDEAFQVNSSYAAMCLMGLRERYRAQDNDSAAQRTFDEYITAAFRKTSVQVMEQCDFIQPGKYLGIFSTLLHRRQHHLAEEFVCSKASHFAGLQDHLAELVGHGFHSLLAKVFASADTCVESRESRDKTAAAFTSGGSNTFSSNSIACDPNNLFFTAVKRELPNMEVVRLLMDQFDIDINALHICQRDGLDHPCTDTVLHLVARGKNWWQVSQAMPYLIKAGADINFRDDMGRTPLHRAMTPSPNGLGLYYREAVETLVGAGANVNAVDDKGIDCLSYASHNLELVKLLMEHGAVITPRAFFTCIGRADAPVVEAMLLGGADSNMLVDKSTMDLNLGVGIQPYELIPLYYAANRRDHWRLQPEEAKVVQLLLKHGANPFAKFRWQVEDANAEKTIVHSILSSGLTAEVFLNIPGLDVNHRDANGCTLLLAACSVCGEPDALLTGGDKLSNQEEANNQQTVFQRLISLGADIRACDTRGRNALHYLLGCRIRMKFESFERPFTELCKMDPGLLNMADVDGKTPLHYAMTWVVKEKTADVPEQLLSFGADPFAVDDEGNNLLHVLAQNLFLEQNRALFEKLVSRGVDINGRNKLGETPLFRFSDPPTTVYMPIGWEKEEANERGLMVMLEGLGADFKARDTKGRGVLHLAARWNVGRFKGLMDMGLDVMLEDDAQQTPIDVAAACGNTAVLQLYEKKDSAR